MKEIFKWLLAVICAPFVIPIGLVVFAVVAIVGMTKAIIFDEEL